MNYKRKVLYLLSMMALPLFGCQKQPLPEDDGYHNDPDTTVNVQPNQPDLPHSPVYPVLPVSDTLRFSWGYDWMGPHEDYVQSYIDDPMCTCVAIIPDTTAQSIKESCLRTPGQWTDIYNSFMNFRAESGGRVTFGGVIYVPQIADNISNTAFGMDRNIANLFKELGITVKVKNATGKPKEKKDTPNKQMPRNMAQSIVQSQNMGYTIEWGFNYHYVGPCRDHVERRTAQYGVAHLVPDSTLWSKMQQQQFDKDHWDYIASLFMKYRDDYEATFEGNLYPFTGRMSPKTKTIFQELGFHVIETTDVKSAKTVPWNQAQQMLQNKSR